MKNSTMVPKACCAPLQSPLIGLRRRHRKHRTFVLIFAIREKRHDDLVAAFMANTADIKVHSPTSRPERYRSGSPRFRGRHPPTDAHQYRYTPLPPRACRTARSVSEAQHGDQARDFYRKHDAYAGRATTACRRTFGLVSLNKTCSTCMPPPPGDAGPGRFRRPRRR